MHRRLFGVDAKKVEGDAGYAGNANRELYRKERIQTSFMKRDRLALVKKELYGLKRIKARTRLTEILYIFFGIHTENVVQLVRREVSEIVQTA